MKISLTFLNCVLALLLVVTPAGSQTVFASEEQQNLIIGARELALAPGMTESLEKMAARKHAQGRLHVALQFPKGVNATRMRTSLEAAGVRLLEPLPGNGYLASLELGGSLGSELYAGHTAPLAANAIRALAPIEPEDKATKDLLAGKIPAWAASVEQDVRYADLVIYYHGDVGERDAIQGLTSMGGRMIDQADYFRRITVRFPADQIQALAERDWVRAIDFIPPPERTSDNTAAAALVGANVLHQEQGLRGAGMKIGIWDGGRVDDHPELVRRLTVVDSGSRSAHATHVAGTMVAEGSREPELKGLAPEAQLFSWDFRGDVMKEMLDAKTQRAIDVSHNSWGFTISEFAGNCEDFGSYASRERELDQLIAKEGLPVVFSMGNLRDVDECVAQPRAGFNTTARPAGAKNVLAVGAVDKNRDIAEFSSAGPTRDGRLKPDLVALGVEVKSTVLSGQSLVASGTSMSAPAVSALSVLLQQQLKQSDPGVKEIPALVKALLLNTARDLGNPGPDYTFGFGVPDAVEAAKSVADKRYAINSVTNEPVEQKIEVPEGTPSLRVMLAYSDAEGPVNAILALVNNLDLVLVSPDGNTRVLPLTPNPSDPKADARPAVNDRDNVEQVVIDKPAAGSWTARVVPTQVTTESQGFVLTWSFAAVGTPPCTTTIWPADVELREISGSFPIVISRGNPCGDWKAESSDGWVRVPSTTQKGTAVVKVNIDENTARAEREAVIRIGDKEVKLKQLAACATGEIKPDETIQGELDQQDCLIAGAFAKLYTFEAQAGQEVEIIMKSSEFDSFLFLRSPTGVSIGADDDSAGGSDAMLRGRLIATGKYTIVANAFDEDEKGKFTLSLRFIDAHPLRGPFVPAEQVRGCPATVDGQLTQNSSRRGLRGELHYTNAYEFPGRRGQTIVADIAASSFDTFVYLIGPSGRLIAQNDDFQGTNRSRIDAVIIDNGNYRLEVTSFEPRVTGTFRLSIDGCSRPAQ